MGLIDRDYMRERRPEDINFRPPRRRPLSAWAITLICCAVLAGLYRAADVYLEHRAAQEDARRRAQAAAAAAASRTEPAAIRRPNSDYFPGAPDHPATGSVAPTAIRPPPAVTVSKCVDARGRTAYSDGPCATGERASRVEARRDINVADAEPVPLAQQRSTYANAQPAGALFPMGAAQPYAYDPRVTCAALDQAIAAYDAQARQPQSAPMQDWISARRKEARDQQFRLKC
ncbi:DUF4124 domain-containing protein [uncultured Xylophilus sp.]|uniref:DUF4124 domain-containing protein n=1 Tax=uncultured Xylophilus sp. TaxID=296832 RepID=UPI0025E10151|nr:DUF4124 domain-containing protein [uncultured Xylophilus sp.]